MGKHSLDHLSIEEKEQLREYINSIKEIKKAIKEMLSPSIKEESEEHQVGGNQSTGKILKI